MTVSSPGPILKTHIRRCIPIGCTNDDQCPGWFHTYSFMSISRSHSLSPYVGQNVCIDIFSVYWSPESRIGVRPRNRLSHFYVLRKWSGQVLSSISLSITGSPRCSLFHAASKWGNHHDHYTSCPAWDGWDESPIWRQRRWRHYMNGASLPSDL